jgi:hypothetical protein
VKTSAACLRHRLWYRVGLVLVLVFTAGCTQATGMGGWIPSVVLVDPSGDTPQRATFGFAFYRDTSDPDSPAFTGLLRGTYHDPRVPDHPKDDVIFKGEGVLRHAATPSPGAPSEVTGCLTGSPTYRSQNRYLPGTGTLLLTVCDRQDPVTGGTIVGDYISISATTGPFMGYTNSGFVKGGKITVK